LASTWLAVESNRWLFRLQARTGEMIQSVAAATICASIWSGAQCLVLRRHGAKAIWWVPANTVAAGVAAGVASFVALGAPVGTYGPGVVMVVVLTAIPSLMAGAGIWGMLTGTTLIWLTRRT
jgi:hypothetical protein